MRLFDKPINSKNFNIVKKIVSRKLKVFDWMLNKKFKAYNILHKKVKHFI